MSDSDDAGAGWQALAPLIDLITPMAMRVAATLRLADYIPSEGISIAELAEHTGTNSDALARMLRHLVQRGVFTEPSPGTFAVNNTAAWLRSEHPAGMRTWLDLDGFGGRMDLAFTGLTHTIRTGEPAWESVFGLPFWSYLDANPAIGASFDETMAIGAGSQATVADSYDWTGISHVVDVGGGTGGLIASILLRNPGLRGTLVDLPETVTRGREYLAAAGLGGRCDVVGQSFFDPLPAGADAYVLSRIIHDWDDAAAATILRRCAEAAGPSGRVLMIESQGMIDDDPAAFAEMNLRMLVLVGGRERTLDDYRALAADAGLRIAAVHRGANSLVVIECVQVQGL